MTNEKRFPIQGGLTVSWEAAERAYKHYVDLVGSGQTLERLAERGGFGLDEFVRFYHHAPTFGMAAYAQLERWRVSALVAGDVRPHRSAPARTRAETLCSTCADQGSCDVKRVDDEHLGSGCDQWRTKENP